MLQKKVSYQRRIDFCPPTFSQQRPESESDTGTFGAAAERIVKDVLTEADGIYLYDSRY